MSRVVLYVCEKCGDAKIGTTIGETVCLHDGEYVDREPVDFIPASVARGLVEALKECSEYMVLPTSADNALAVAEEELG